MFPLSFMLNLSLLNSRETSWQWPTPVRQKSNCCHFVIHFAITLLPMRFHKQSINKEKDVVLNPKNAALTSTRGWNSSWKEIRTSARSLLTLCLNFDGRETAGDCNDVIGSTGSHNTKAKDERPLCHWGDVYCHHFSSKGLKPRFQLLLYLVEITSGVPAGAPTGAWSTSVQSKGSFNSFKICPFVS